MNTGWIALHRKLIENEIFNTNQCTRDLWLYFLLSAQHESYKDLARGELFFRFKDFQDAFCWYAGYRKIKYPKHAITKSLRKLRESNMIATTKATHGTLVKVLKYNEYQAVEKHESNHESSAKATRKQQQSTNINNNDNNDNNIKGGEIQKVLETYNQVYNVRTKSSRAWEKNFLKWRNDYSLEEVLVAITNMREHSWIGSLSDRFGLEKFFRTDKDWIGECKDLGAVMEEKLDPDVYFKRI